MSRTTDGLIILGPGEGDAFGAMDAVRKSTAADGDGRWGDMRMERVPYDADHGTSHEQDRR